MLGVLTNDKCPPRVYLLCINFTMYNIYISIFVMTTMYDSQLSAEDNSSVD